VNPGASLLIVGGTGFLAQATLRGALHAGYRVFATRRGATALEAGVQWLGTDLTQPDCTANWPATCDHVIFLAQARNWRAFPGTAVNTLDVNVRGLLQTLLYAQTHQVKQMVYLSTGSVYSHADSPQFETNGWKARGPASFYAATKLAAEMVLEPFRASFPIVVVRLYAPYGPGQPGDMLIPNIIGKVRSGQAVQLHRPAGLLCNPIFHEDAADGILRCLGLNMSATLNLAGADVLTLKQIALVIGKELGVPPMFEMAVGTPPSILGDTRHAARLLEFRPSICFREGIRRLLHAA
jgi:nucleoside-diphosphate-sugar epimerase